MHAVLGPELRIDPGLGRGVMKVRPEGNQFPAAHFEILKLPTDHILRVVVCSRSCWRQGDASWPVEEWRTRVVERVRRSPYLAIEIRQSCGNAAYLYEHGHDAPAFKGVTRQALTIGVGFGS